VNAVKDAISGDLDDADEGHRRLLELVRAPSPRSMSMG
jgi:hypothetical protein